MDNLLAAFTPPTGVAVDTAITDMVGYAWPFLITITGVMIAWGLVKRLRSKFKA